MFFSKTSLYIGSQSLPSIDTHTHAKHSEESQLIIRCDKHNLHALPIVKDLLQFLFGHWGDFSLVNLIQQQLQIDRLVSLVRVDIAHLVHNECATVLAILLATFLLLLLRGSLLFAEWSDTVVH